MAKKKSKTLHLQSVPRIIRPSRSARVTWRRPIQVLLRMGNLELWRLTGQTRILGKNKAYIPGGLVMVKDAENHWFERSGDMTPLQAGGRVCRKSFVEHRDAITQFFGADFYVGLMSMGAHETLIARLL